MSHLKQSDELIRGGSMNELIEVNGLTKGYGKNRGIIDVHLRSPKVKCLASWGIKAQDKRRSCAC